VALAGTASLAAAQSAAPIAGEADSYVLSDPVREVASEPPAVGDGERGPVRVVPLQGVPAAADGAGAAASDPLKDKGAAPGKTPAPDLIFDGLSTSDNEFPGLPPDTVGDVGPSHYIQMTNATKVAIFNKNGTPALPRSTSARCGRRATVPCPTVTPRSSGIRSRAAGCCCVHG
jgi:hypothetical protein